MITIEIEIAYPKYNGVKGIELELMRLEVAQGTTVAGAIDQAMLDIDWSCHNVGIFGRIVAMNTVLRSKDRIEVCPELLVDPKILRKDRAKQSKP